MVWGYHYFRKHPCVENIHQKTKQSSRTKPQHPRRFDWNLEGGVWNRVDSFASLAVHRNSMNRKDIQRYHGTMVPTCCGFMKIKQYTKIICTYIPESTKIYIDRRILFISSFVSEVFFADFFSLPFPASSGSRGRRPVDELQGAQNRLR